MKKLHILIDNGHGKETPGKRSPDERLMEWKWNREFAKMLSDRLTELNISNELLVEEDKYISLKSRCDRANITYKTLKCKCIDTLFISIHVNAAADTGWNKARGFTCWIYTKAGSKSVRLAQIFSKNSKEMKLTGNRSLPAAGYYTANYYVVKNTLMPAILCENMFMDNKDDVEFLLSGEGKKKLIQLYENSILEYMKEYSYE